MIKTAVLVAAGLAAAPLLAQEQLYVYIKYKDATGASVRYRLDCLDADCKVDTKTGERRFSLATDRKNELLDALQAESKHFFAADDPSSGDDLVKVKLRYDTPGKRLEIERRLPREKPADLTPEMLQVIKAHFDLDFSKPVAPGPDAEKASDPSSARSGAG